MKPADNTPLYIRELMAEKDDRPADGNGQETKATGSFTID
jgi:hypothetical protein